MRGSAWRRWNWLEQGLIPLVSAATRAAWMTPLVHIILNNPLVAPQGTEYPAWLILLLLLAASSARYGLQTHPQGPILAACGGFLAVAGAFAYLYTQPALSVARNATEFMLSLTDFQQGIPAPLLVLFITGALWRRGMTVEWKSHGEFWRDFIIGTIVLGLLMVLPSSALGTLSHTVLGGFCVAFVITGLLALGLLGVLDTLVLERVRESIASPLSRYWLIAVGSVVLAIVLAGWAIGQILSPNTIAGAWQAIRPLTRFVGQILEYILVAIIYLLVLILVPLFNALRAGLRLPPEISEPRPPKLPEELSPPESLLKLSPALLLALRISLLLAIAAGIALAFWLVRQRRQGRSEDGVSEKRELIWSKELLLRQLRDLLGRKPGGKPVSPFLKLSQPEEPRQAIRLLYQQLLARARDLGYARPPGLTPRGYQNVLLGLLPDQQTALNTLTTLYILARYAPEDPQPEDVLKARQALMSIEEALTSRAP